MKKIYFSLIALGLLALSSACTKEQDVVIPENNEGTITISASIEEPTKTTYDPVSGEFSWTDGDYISYIVKSSTSGKYNRYTYSTQNSGSTASFSGDAPSGEWSAVDYAFYPYNGDAAGGYDHNTFDKVDATTFQAFIYGVIKAYPERLKGIVPMIGKKTGTDANGTVEHYHFYPVTGILKLSFTGLPSTANQIRISTPDAATYPLRGTFNIDTSREIPEIKASDIASGKGARDQWLNFVYSSSSDAFYIPIPTGTIPAGDLTISVVNYTNGTAQSYYTTVTNKKDIVINRGEITELPTITIPSLKVKLSGTASDPKATFYFSGDVAYVKYGRNMTNSGTGGGNSGTVSTSGSSIDLRHDFNYKYPLYYQAYNSSDEPLESIQRIDYWGINATGISEICKQFTSAIGDIGLADTNTVGHRVPRFTNNAPFSATTPTITFAVSDDITKGNIVVTEFCGVEGKVYAKYEDYTFKESDNTTPKKDAPQINVLKEVFCTVGGNEYKLVDSGDYTPGARFAVKSTVYGTPNVYDKDANLVCWGQYVKLYSSATVEGPSVEYFFDAVPHTYTVAGDQVSVFGGSATWDATLTANDLVYSSATHLYSKTFTVPASIDAVTFKVAQDHAWTNSWGSGSGNYTATKDHTGYDATLTVNFNENTGAVSHSYSYSSDYILHVKQEELAAATTTKWGTNRSVWCTKDFIQLADADGYKRFMIPQTLIDATNDLYYKGENGCEVKLSFSPVTATTNYYYKTNGFEIVPETGSYTSEKRVWVQSNLVETLYAYMWQSDNESNNNGWDTCAMQSNGAKYDSKPWYYRVIPASTDKLIISWGGRSEGNENERTVTPFTIDSSKSQYYYVTYNNNTYYKGQIFATPWTEES